MASTSDQREFVQFLGRLRETQTLLAVAESLGPGPQAASSRLSAANKLMSLTPTCALFIPCFPPLDCGG